MPYTKLRLGLQGNEENTMKTHIALALWLAASGYAWAEGDGANPQTSPTAPARVSGPVGWESTGGETTSGAAPVKPVIAANAQAASGDDSLPPPPPPSANLQQARAAIAPLTPGQVRELVAQDSEIDQAVNSTPVTVVPRISALTVDLSPGASLPLVRTAVNYPSSLSFIDSTGAPWKLGAAPLSGNPSFKVFWIPNSPVMVVRADKPFKSGNITVYLDGLSVPLILNVSSGETDTQAQTWTVDSRLDMRIPRRGPAALPGAAPEMRIGLHDRTLQAFLDGVPPQEARQLKTTGGVPDTTVWQLGDDLYVRSRADIRDEFEQTLSSADGTHLWRLPLTPYVSFSVMGRTAALNVALE
jgi:intracellular multiplication protein IcmK